jgi:FMN phosphatase YigB (HAD superfamily)
LTAWKREASCGTSVGFCSSSPSSRLAVVVGRRDWGWAFEAMLDVRRLTDVVVISAEVGVEKPDPDIYRLAPDALGVDPTGCVLVDDLLENLDGAATIGIAGVLHLRNDGTMRAVGQALQ